MGVSPVLNTVTKGVAHIEPNSRPVQTSCYHVDTISRVELGWFTSFFNCKIEKMIEAVRVYLLLYNSSHEHYMRTKLKDE